MKSKINFTTAAGIKEWAKSVYEDGGHWIYECWSDEELTLFIKHRKDGREVRRDLYKYIKEMSEYESEIKSA